MAKSEIENMVLMMATAKIIAIFESLIEAAKTSTPEVQAFVKTYSDEVDNVAGKVEGLIGTDFYHH